MTTLSIYHVLCLLILCVCGQESPCPNIFRYEHDGSQWYGVIRLPASYFGTSISIQLLMHIYARLPTNYIGRIETVGSKTEVAAIVSGGGIVTYRVHFPLQDPIPKVDSLLVNNGEYCPGNQDNYAGGSTTYTSLKLNHALSLGSGYRPNLSPGSEYRPNLSPARPSSMVARPNPPTRPPYISYPITRPNPPTQPEYVPQTNPPVRETTPSPIVRIPEERPQLNNDLNDICGTRDVQPTNALITYGIKTNRGEWPWIAAIFIIENGGYTFICSGTLISSVHVVTAAHCIDKNKSRVVKLGVKTINNWHDKDQKTLKVMKEIVHPDFDEEKLYNDIALMKINEVEFSKYIKPACYMPTESFLIGQRGTVVGWGKDETGKTSPDLRKAYATIVSNEECKRVDFRAPEYINENTVCAGEKDGSGPCNGDSGGGLFLQKDGRWYIRGIVSNSLPDLDTGAPCTNKAYVIYTYFEKYISWLEYAKTNI